MSGERTTGLRRSQIAPDDDDYYIGAPDGSKPKYPIQQRQNRKGGGVVVETTTLGDGCSDLIDQFSAEKTSAVVIYTFAMCAFIITAAAFFGWPALLPYIYIVLTPPFIVIRVVYYFKQKWQYLLLDLSFILQLNTFAYLWAGPDSVRYSQITFGLSLGILSWICDFFPKSWCFVPHSGDRMMNIFFAFFPSLMMYNVRHRPELISDWWYEDFLKNKDEPTIAANFGWVFGIPFGIVVVHFIIYSLLVYLVFRPERSEYPTTFYQIMADQDSYLVRFIEFFSDRVVAQYAVYTFLYLVASAISLMLAVMFWENEVTCTIFLCCQVVYPIWNGGHFYISVLGPKNFDPKEY